MNEETLKHLEEVIAAYDHNNEATYEDYRCNAINTFPGLVSSLREARRQSTQTYEDRIAFEAAFRPKLSAAEARVSTLEDVLALAERVLRDVADDPLMSLPLSVSATLTKIQTVLAAVKKS